MDMGKATTVRVAVDMVTKVVTAATAVASPGRVASSSSPRRKGCPNRITRTRPSCL